jgi:DNA-directed RNA polymerase subunit F
MNITNERSATLAEVQSLLKKRQKDGELSYEQSNSLAYAESFAKLDVKEAQSLDRALEKLGFLTPAARSGLVDLLPKKEDEVKAVLAREGIEAGDEQIKEVLKALKARK